MNCKCNRTFKNKLLPPFTLYDVLFSLFYYQTNLETAPNSSGRERPPGTSTFFILQHKLSQLSLSFCMFIISKSFDSIRLPSIAPRWRCCDHDRCILNTNILTIHEVACTTCHLCVHQIDTIDSSIAWLVMWVGASSTTRSCSPS